MISSILFNTMYLKKWPHPLPTMVCNIASHQRFYAHHLEFALDWNYCSADASWFLCWDHRTWFRLSLIHQKIPLWQQPIKEQSSTGSFHASTGKQPSDNSCLSPSLIFSFSILPSHISNVECHLSSPVSRNWLPKPLSKIKGLLFYASTFRVLFCYAVICSRVTLYLDSCFPLA